MKQLSIEEAFELYQVIGEYIPDIADDELEFIGTIVHNIRDGDRPRDYVKALSILTGYSAETITESIAPEDSLEFLYEGLAINQVKSLKDFCDRLNYG